MDCKNVKCARKAVGSVRQRYVIDWAEAELVDGLFAFIFKEMRIRRTFQSIEDGH